MLRLTASDFYTYFRSSKCEVRIYLKSIGMEEGPPGSFDEILLRLGERHEKAHPTIFPIYEDLREGTFEERVQRTSMKFKKAPQSSIKPFWDFRDILKL